MLADTGVNNSCLHAERIDPIETEFNEVVDCVCIHWMVGCSCTLSVCCVEVKGTPTPHLSVTCNCSLAGVLSVMWRSAGMGIDRGREGVCVCDGD